MRRHPGVSSAEDRPAVPPEDPPDFEKVAALMEEYGVKLAPPQ